jgi:hypothetical protein
MSDFIEATFSTALANALAVIPAKAGIQWLCASRCMR